jgi:predicted 3-demethylubiquinone-9 3-methyltransferase (glyoxalase superfamily)
MQKITPFLWFDNQAEEAAQFYTSIFKNSRISKIVRYGEESMGTPGTVMTVEFLLDGQEFVALNGGPVYTFTPATSFYVHCDTQQEVDNYWDRLLEGGEAQQCGWLTDRYGVTWQIVPTILIKMLDDPDPEKARRVTKAMLQMIKLDIDQLERAYKG